MMMKTPRFTFAGFASLAMLLGLFTCGPTFAVASLQKSSIPAAQIAANFVPQLYRDSSHQLNLSGFTGCLTAAAPVDWNFINSRYSFGPFDLLLPFLAVYPGVRLPAPLSDLQNRADRKWSGDWDALQLKLAESFVVDPPKFPIDVFSRALSICPLADVFCAALISHDVLRTLGRYEQGLRQDSKDHVTDYNPAWFRANRDEWLKHTSAIQQSMISLYQDGAGDRWGEWYHFFGILSYAIHAVQIGGGAHAVDFVARMNEVLNPLLAGEAEDPRKAQVDRDAAEIVFAYLTANLPADPAMGAAAYPLKARESKLRASFLNLNCRSREAYVSTQAIGVGAASR